MSERLAFLEISKGKRFLYIPERKCPVEVVFREAQELLKTEGALLIFKGQALIAGSKDAMIPGDAITINQYDASLPPADQMLEFNRAAMLPEDDLYETIRMLVQGCVLKVTQGGTDSEVVYELTDEG